MQNSHQYNNVHKSPYKKSRTASSVLDSDVDIANTSMSSSSLFVPTPRDYSLSSDSFLDSGLSGSEYGGNKSSNTAGNRPLSANSDRSVSSYSTSSSGIGLLGKTVTPQTATITPENRHRIYKTTSCDKIV